MPLEDLIQRIDQLIQKADEVIQSKEIRLGPFDPMQTYVNEGLFHAFRSASLSFLAMTFGKEHIHYVEFNSEADQSKLPCAEIGRGILSVAREELAGGWLTTTKGLISAEIFSDFLEMAQHLLDEGYKDPAAVMAGSVLEEHLRQLCQKHGIPTEATKQGKQGRPQPKKADALNAGLAKKKVYNQLDQKNVIAWLDLRNKAAHGKYPEYTKEHVSQMLQGLSNFMVRIPL
ncbi:MAG: hypothetical protein OXH81_08090 [Gemmatimonadetes bacterium]|nr:hypothetical protein [Gemmatimonadota bacterium]